MKLGYLVPEWPSQTHAFFLREIEALRDGGAQVEVISTRRPTAPCRHAFAAQAARQTHYLFPPHPAMAIAALGAHPLAALRAGQYVASLHESPVRRAKLFGLIACAADLLAFCRQKRLDHLHVHSCADAAHLAALCHRLGGPSYSLTLHGDLPVYGRDFQQKMGHALFVAAVTRALQKQIVEQVGLDGGRVPVVWMGVDTQVFSPAWRDAANTGRMDVLTIARLQRSKGHRFLLAALRRVVERGLDVHYTIAGDGPDRREIVEEIRRLNLTGRVRLVGTVSVRGVVELLHAHDVFVLPSVGLGEAAPVAVMEAMACGLPVICSIIGGTPDMIDDQVDGLLTPQQDDSALAAAIERLYLDAALRRRLGQAARQKAVDIFDIRQTSRKLLQEITSHITNTPAHRR